jgi:hypothetical protein
MCIGYVDECLKAKENRIRIRVRKASRQAVSEIFAGWRVERGRGRENGGLSACYLVGSTNAIYRYLSSTDTANSAVELRRTRTKIRQPSIPANVWLAGNE